MRLLYALSMSGRVALTAIVLFATQVLATTASSGNFLNTAIHQLASEEIPAVPPQYDDGLNIGAFLRYSSDGSPPNSDYKSFVIDEIDIQISNIPLNVVDDSFTLPSEGEFNDLQAVPIPEPLTAASVLLGIIGLGAYMRRRTRVS